MLATAPALTSLSVARTGAHLRHQSDLNPWCRLVRGPAAGLDAETRAFPSHVQPRVYDFRHRFVLIFPLQVITEVKKLGWLFSSSDSKVLSGVVT